MNNIIYLLSYILLGIATWKLGEIIPISLKFVVENAKRKSLAMNYAI